MIGSPQVSELLQIAGISYVGPIPDDVQKITMFPAGITTRARFLQTARRLIAFLASAEAAPMIARTSMTPQTGAPPR